MKLITRNGELDLPQDFSMTMERTNPLLSGEGDASVPASLPSSSRNLSAFGHRERIDRAERYTNKVDAILQVGPVQKHGRLIIDTMHRREGVDASFAIDNSDLYASSKNKTLKEVFASYNNGAGYCQTFNDINEACRTMEDVYLHGNANGDYLVFPVAIAAYEDNGETVYQYNNKINGSNGLVWEADDPNMVVHEGDVPDMDVPDGYSVAPFLKLSRLVELLFSILGYTMTENCLTEYPFKRIVVVHNCSDCLCTKTTSVTLRYKDLVPSCTVSEFLEWLNNKFHVQPVVDSTTKHVKIVAMETMLSIAPDMDISRIVEGDLSVQLNPSKRVVMTPTNSIDGTEPAAETFDKLIEKYGDYAMVNEVEFLTLNTANPAVMNGLILRRSTGMFYALSYNSNLARYETKQLGTNHFTYDRANSEETEDFSQDDCLPLMLCGPKCEVTPFIGERLHAHTSYNGSTADEKQDIIVVQAVTDADHFCYNTTGTTQPVIPYVAGENGKYFYELGFGLTPYDLYEACWQRYNNLLLNHLVNLKGRVRYSVGQVLGMDMTRLKHCLGQRLMPVSMSAPIAVRPGLTEAEFLLVKMYIDGISDSPILPSSMSDYVWEVTDNSESVASDLWVSMGGSANFGNIDIQDTNQGVEAHYMAYTGFSVRYVGDDLQPGTPSQNAVVTLTRQAVFNIYYNEIVEYDQNYSPNYSSSECQTVFSNQTVIFVFTAVPA